MKKGGIMWLARDGSGDLFLYEEKPQKDFFLWKISDSSEIFLLDKALFPEVKWEDEEPTEVELIIKQKK